VPWREAAIAASTSALVSPASDGGMHRRDVPLDVLLRRALGRAGIAESWTHIRRPKGCGHREAADGAQRRCPKCPMKLWPKPNVRPLRFHYLRHSTAALTCAEDGFWSLWNPSGDLEHEDASLARNVLNSDGAAVRVDRLLGDGQTQAESALAGVETHEGRERFLNLPGW
jgi:hypothetical protein